MCLSFLSLSLSAHSKIMEAGCNSPFSCTCVWVFCLSLSLSAHSKIMEEFSGCNSPFSCTCVWVFCLSLSVPTARLWRLAVILPSHVHVSEFSVSLSAHSKIMEAGCNSPFSCTCVWVFSLSLSLPTARLWRLAVILPSHVHVSEFSVCLSLSAHSKIMEAGCNSPFSCTCVWVFCLSLTLCPQQDYGGWL